LLGTWTAPSTGSISLRGRALKNDTAGGDGVKIRISKNATVIWPANGTPQALGASDLDGYNTNLDAVSVTSGDQIRFEVNNGGSGNASNDLTSWAPTVAYASSTSSSLAVFDDTDTGITYRGTWGLSSGLNQSTWISGTSHYSNSTGAYAQYTCSSCQEILWNATKSPDAGNVKIYIDGTLVTSLDMYAATREGSRVRFGTGVFGTAGQHTLKLEVSGTKNPSSSNTYLEVDAFQTVNGPSIVDDPSTNITYSGTFGSSSGLDQNTWVNGTSHYSNSTGAYAQYNCSSCREIVWSATKSPDQGIAKLYVDGVLVTTLDMYASAREGSRARFGTGVFGNPGPHTLKVEVSGSKNASATNTYLEIDAFQSVP
jgi:hypothetical protein